MLKVGFAEVLLEWHIVRKRACVYTDKIKDQYLVRYQNSYWETEVVDRQRLRLTKKYIVSQDK